MPAVAPTAVGNQRHALGLVVDAAGGTGGGGGGDCLVGGGDRVALRVAAGFFTDL